MSTLVPRQPGESAPVPINFAPNLAADENITAITSYLITPATGITITNLAIDVGGKKIQALVTISASILTDAGVESLSMKITAKVVTNLSPNREGDGILIIRNT